MSRNRYDMLEYSIRESKLVISEDGLYRWYDVLSTGKHPYGDWDPILKDVKLINFYNRGIMSIYNMLTENYRETPKLYDEFYPALITLRIIKEVLGGYPQVSIKTVQEVVECIIENLVLPGNDYGEFIDFISYEDANGFSAVCIRKDKLPFVIYTLMQNEKLPVKDVYTVVSDCDNPLYGFISEVFELQFKSIPNIMDNTHKKPVEFPTRNDITAPPARTLRELTENSKVFGNVVKEYFKKNISNIELNPDNDYGLFAVERRYNADIESKVNAILSNVEELADLPF